MFELVATGVRSGRRPRSGTWVALGFWRSLLHSTGMRSAADDLDHSVLSPICHSDVIGRNRRRRCKVTVSGKLGPEDAAVPAFEAFRGDLSRPEVSSQEPVGGARRLFGKERSPSYPGLAQAREGKAGGDPLHEN